MIDDLISLTDECPNFEDLLLFDITYATYCSIQRAETLTKLKRVKVLSDGNSFKCRVSTDKTTQGMCDCYMQACQPLKTYMIM